MRGTARGAEGQERPHLPRMGEGHEPRAKPLSRYRDEQHSRGGNPRRPIPDGAGGETGAKAGAEGKGVRLAGRRRGELALIVDKQALWIFRSAFFIGKFQKGWYNTT